MVTIFKAPTDLGKLIVRNVIGEVFGNNLIRVTLDLFNYRQIVNSIATEKVPGTVPALPYTVEYDDKVKQRVFNLYGMEVIVVYNLITYKPEFFMDATIANSICEHFENTEKKQVSRGFSTRVVTA
jgi:hypothetical protein